MPRYTTCATSSPIPLTTTHRCVPRAHTLTYTQRDTSIDGAHRTPTKGVLSALVIAEALYHMGRMFANTSYYHP